MNVLHVTVSAGRRGGEIFAADLVGALADCGVDQRVAVLRPQGDGGVRFPVSTDDLAAGGRVIPGLRIRVGTASGLRRLIRGWQPDVIQCHGGEPFKYALLAGRGSGVPIVYRRIGGAPRWLRRGPRRWAHAQLMRRAARIVAVAEAVREETLSLFGVPDERVVTIPNGVDPGRLAPTRRGDEVRAELSIPPSAPVTLSLGSLSWEKDPEVQLRVIERVQEGSPSLVHLMAGEGPMRSSLERAVAGSGLDGRVRLLGARRDVGDLMAAADVLLFTSRGDGMEGMPAALIEAGMAGLPVVAYEVAGVREVVADGVTGSVVPRGDVSGLVDSVYRLIRDDELRRRLGRDARRLCGARFDIRVIAPKYLDLYLSILESR